MVAHALIVGNASVEAIPAEEPRSTSLSRSLLEHFAGSPRWTFHGRVVAALLVVFLLAGQVGSDELLIAQLAYNFLPDLLPSMRSPL
jgi:hypothetical protein